MRSRHKEWQNAPHNKWTARIIWYQDDVSIRLKRENLDGVDNLYFKRPEGESAAKKVWEEFKAKFNLKAS